MTSEEYIQVIQELMELQDKQVNWIFAILGLLIALAAFYQWRISSGDKETLIKEIDNKTSELRREFKDQLTVEAENNANGHYIRYPDGNQTCRHSINVDRESYQKDISWVYPASFYGKDITVFAEVEDTDKIKIKKVIKETHQIIILLERSDKYHELGDTRINLLAYGYWKPLQKNYVVIEKLNRNQSLANRLGILILLLFLYRYWYNDLKGGDKVISAILQYRVEGKEEQNSIVVEIKTLPRSGEYIQIYEVEAFKVERVYHIPKTIKNEQNEGKADVILFGKFVLDLEVSNF